MVASQAALFGYLFWALLLGFGVVGVRTHAQFTARRKANSFLADGSDLGPFGHRITRVHGNSMEWIAIPVGFLMYAIATGQTEITGPLAFVALGARIAQSTTHLVSTSATAVSVRGLFLGVQNVVWVIWGYQLVTAA